MPESSNSNLDSVTDSTIIFSPEAPRKREGVFGTERIRELKKPLVVLVQVQNPSLFREIDSEKGVTKTQLTTPLTWEVVQDLTRVYYEPYLLVPRNAKNGKLENFVESEKVEEAGKFGPFSVYRFLREGNVGRIMTFGSRKKASQAIAEIIPEDIRYQQPEIDKKPKVPEEKERYFKGIKLIAEIIIHRSRSNV